MHSRSLALLLLLAPAFPASADWPNFRGPRGTGIAEDGATGPAALTEETLAWSSDLPGRGLSSPIVVGDRVFLTCSSGPLQDRLHLICFAAADGKKLWHREYWATGRTMTHEKTCVAAPTPASDGKRVFAIYSSNDVFCTDLDGNLLWTRGLTYDYPNASNSLGMASSPVVIDDTFVAQIENDSESFAVGLDVLTGANKWKIDRPKAANWTSPVVVGPAGQEIVALQSSKGILGVVPSTGAEVWNYSEGAATMASSAAFGDIIYAPSNGLTAFKAASNGASVEQLWRQSEQRPGTGSPLVLGDKGYVINGAGVLNAIRLKDGERLWRIRLKGPFSSSPIATATHLYVFSEPGIGQCVDLTGAEGVVTSEVDLKETILGTPSLSGSAVYVRSDKHLWRFGK